MAKKKQSPKQQPSEVIQMASNTDVKIITVSSLIRQIIRKAWRPRADQTHPEKLKSLSKYWLAEIISGSCMEKWGPAPGIFAIPKDILR